jgi:hypothetical protein
LLAWCALEIDNLPYASTVSDRDPEEKHFYFILFYFYHLAYKESSVFGSSAEKSFLVK